jgi:nucleotide-binding universal stress UspA family protein
MKPRVILCVVDFSKFSKLALAEAVKVARERGACLDLVHVVEMPWAFSQDPMGSPALFEGDFEGPAAELAEWGREAQGLGGGNVQTHVVQGAPWEAICEMAEVLGAELVVLGTHGRTGLRYVVLGSVAEKVLHHAPCSVLVVRPPRHAAEAAASAA